MTTRQSELCLLSASAMERLLRQKQISAVELVEAHLRQIERLNPAVTAIVTLVADRALEDARRADNAAARGDFLGPLHGLPVVHKDLHETKGIRTTYGSPLFRDYVPDFDALIVERIQRAGAVVIGKTNTPEFGAGSQTFNPVFGATRNPYDLSKTCGGSSGGAAVALACGMAALAEGSDTGGSLRNPASFCSVVGLRPSPGRVPAVPAKSAWNTLNVLGPMARNVTDAALLLSAIAGPDERSPLSIHEPGSKFSEPLGRDFAGVRLAWCPDFAGLPFDRRVREVFESSRQVFDSLGCIVENARPDFSGADESFRVFRALSFYTALGELLPRQRDAVKETVIQEIEHGGRLTPAQIAEAEIKRSRLFETIGEFLTNYEFLVLPTTQVPPFDIGQQWVGSIDGVRMADYIDWMRSCYYVSVLGLPAISVPAGFTAEGLPVGLQIVGRHQDDFGVLQLAYAFEQALGLDNAKIPRPLIPAAL
jgi:amidase